MKYLRLLVVVIVLLGVVFALWLLSSPIDPAPPDKPAAVTAPDAPASAPKPTASSTIAPPKIAAPMAQPVVASTVAKAAPAASAPSTVEYQPQADLNDFIAQTIKLLQGKDYVGIVMSVRNPNALQQAIARGEYSSVEDYAKDFSQRPRIDQQMTTLLQALQSIQGQTPEINDDGSQATYATAIPLTGTSDPGHIIFFKVDGYWHIK